MNVVAIHKTKTDLVKASEIKVDGKITNDNATTSNIKFSVKANANAKTSGDLEVTDDEIVKVKDGIIIGANPFVIGRKNIATMSDADYLAYSGANAMLEDGSAKVDVKVTRKLDASLTAETKQKVEFTATKGDKSVSIEVDAQILDGYTELGENYILSGRDFEITGKEAKDLVDNPTDTAKDSILTKNTNARLVSYKKYSLVQEGTVVVSDRSQIKNKESETGYPTKYKVKNTSGVVETSPELELKVNVTEGVAPTIITHKTSQINLGETFIAKNQFVSGTAINDGKHNLSFDDVNVSGVEAIDNTKVGVYEVEYSYTDSYGLTAKAKHLVIVNDGSVQETDKHIIYGENVGLKVSEVDSNVEATIKSRANAYAYEIETGKKVDDSKISILKGDVVAQEGIYTSKIKVEGDSTTKDIKVLVDKDFVKGDEFIISANNTEISVKDAKLPKAELDPMLVRKSSAKAVAKTSLDPVDVLVEHSINEEVKDHNATYYVNKVGTTTKDVKVDRIVTVGKDKEIDNKGDIYIRANDFVVEKDKIDALDDAGYAALAKAKAEHKTDTENNYTPYVMGSKLDKNGAATQTIKFGVKKNNVELSEPFVEVEAIINDGPVVKGDTHTLAGEHFSITGTQAASVLNATNNDKDNILIDGGKVKSYLNNSIVLDGDVYVKDKSDLKASDGTYKVKFGVKVNGVELATPVLELNVKVTMASAPTLEIVSDSKINLNAAFDAKAQFISGHDYAENKDLTFEDISVDTSDVDVTTIGIYKVKYSYKDSSEQVVTKTHTLAVGPITQIDDYYVYGENAYLNVKDIKGKSASEIEALAKPQMKISAVNRKTGENLDSSKISVIGFDKVEAKDKDYPITIKIDGASQTKEVSLVVTNGTITPGKDYTLISNGTSVTSKEVKLPGLDTLVITRSNTRAIHNTTNARGTISVDVSGIQAVKDEYPVTFKVTQEPGLQHDEKVNVTDSDVIGEDKDVYIEGSSFTIGTDRVKELNDDTSFQKYIKEASVRAWSDDVDGPFTIKVKEDTKLKPVKGNQTVVYYVEEYPNAKISVNVEVTEGGSEKGDTYTITGKSIQINAADALEIMNGPSDKTNKIFGESYANVKVYKNQSTEIVDENVSFDKGNLNNVAGSYKVKFTVDKDIKATIELNVSVSQGNLPTFTVGSTQKVDIKTPEAYNELYQVSLTDNNGGGVLTLKPVYTEEAFKADEGGLIFIDKTELKLDKLGHYIVKYKAKDNYFNVVEGTQVVTVTNGEVPPVIEGYNIFAQNVVLDYYSEVQGRSDAQIAESILAKSKGYAININDFTRKPLEIVSLGDGFVKDEATNNVEVSVVGVPKAKTTIKVVISKGPIVDGEDYILTYKDAYSTVKTLSPMTKQQVSDHVVDKANAIALPKVGTVNGHVKFDEEVKAVKNIYDVTYYVVEEPATKSNNAKVDVKDKDVLVEKGDYIISADHFEISLSDIDKFSESKYVEIAKAEVENRNTKVVTTPSLGNRPAKAVGEQAVTFTTSLMNGLEATVNADVKDKDVIIKNDYVITAEPVTISVEQAITLVEEIGNGNDSTIKSLSKVEAHTRKDKTSVDVSMVEGSSTIAAKAGTYKISFKVDKDTTVSIDVKVTVSNGVAPTLNVPEYVVVKLNATDFDKFAGVSAFDNNKNKAIPQSKIRVSGDVDLSVSKEYVLEYEVVDANLNVVKAKSTIIVDDGTPEIIGDYVVRAKNFGILVDNVNSGAGAKTQILELSEASAHNFKTHKDVSLSELQVVDTKGYKKAVGEYKDIEIGIKNTNVIKKIDANVTADPVINGKIYSITAKSATIGQVEAKAMSEEQLLTTMGVKVTKRVSNANVPEGIAVVDNFADFSTNPNTYTMSFSVRQEPETTISNKIRVWDRDIVVVQGAYTIAANNFYVGLDDLNTITPQQLVDLSKAYAVRTTGSDEVVVPARWVSGPAKELGPNKPVEFAVAEKQDVKTTSFATVLEGNVTQDDDYYINSKSVSIPISDLTLIQNGTKDIYDVMSVNVYKKGESTPLGTQKTETDISALVAKKATYPITFYFESNDGTKRRVTSNMKLNEGNAPQISVDKKQEIKLNSSDVYNDKLGLTYSDIEDDNNPLAPELKVTITGNEEVKELIKKKIAKVVTVRYDVEDFDGNVSTAYQTVIINDGSIVVGENYAIEAKHFSIESKNVVVGEAQLIEKSQAKAYKLGTADEMGNVKAVSSDYSSVAKDYNVDLSVVEEPATKMSIVASVTDGGVVEGDDYTITAQPGFLGLKDAKNVKDAKVKEITNPVAKNNRTGEDAEVKLVSHNIGQTPGTYEAIYKVVKEEQTTIKVVVKVLDFDYVVTDGKYIVAGNDFKIGQDDIANGITNKQYVDLASANAFNRYDETKAYDVEMDETTAPVDTDTTVTFRVVEHTSSSVDVKATVKEGKVITGSKYSIMGKDASIYVSTADKILKDEVSMVETMKATAESKDGKAGTVEFVSSNLKAAHGKYTVMLRVKEEPTTQITLDINVDKGEAPVINVSDYTEIQVGQTFNSMKDISAIDDRDGNITNKVQVEGTVDVNTAGTYKLTYTVIDSDFNTTSEERLVIVNDGTIVVKDGYILDAEHFTINKDDVDTSDAAILAKTNAYAYVIATKEKVDVDVLSKGGYKNVKGDYTIQLAVKDKKSVTRDISASVVDGGVIKGDKYYISANDITMGLVDAKTLSDQDIIARAEAKATHRRLGTSGTVTISSKTLQPVAGDYVATYQVVEDTSASITKDIKVLDKDIVIEDGDYIISANNFMVGDQFIKEMSKEDIVKLAKVEAFNKKSPSVLLPVTQEEGIITSIGKHKVTFVIVESPKTKVQVEKTIFKDTMFYIEAHDAEINISDLTKAMNSGTIDSTVITITGAKGYKVNGDGSKEEMKVYIANKDQLVNAKAGTKAEVKFSLNNPADPNATAEKYKTSTHKLEEANVSATVLVGEAKDGGNTKGGKTTATGVMRDTYAYAALVLSFSALILLIILKKKRKEGER